MEPERHPSPRADNRHPAARDALDWATADSVLAIITGVEGPSYRPLGEIMALRGDDRAGSLSSGCIEGDLAVHAQTAKPMRLRYGEGSPFMDIRLPCGGGLDIALVPHPDAALLARIREKRAARIPCALRITPDLTLEECDYGPTGDTPEGFRIALRPEPRFLIFGKGPEAAFFADLVNSAHYPHLLLSPEEETLSLARSSGCATEELHWPAFPADLAIDARTAVVLFFHDHDWEPPILARALDSEAFYVGAQGSQRARDARLAALREIDATGTERLRGPIGLIPSVRDPRTLAVSVLAEVLEAAR